MNLFTIKVKRHWPLAKLCLAIVAVTAIALVAIDAHAPAIASPANEPKSQPVAPVEAPAIPAPIKLRQLAPSTYSAAKEALQAKLDAEEAARDAAQDKIDAENERLDAEQAAQDAAQDAIDTQNENQPAPPQAPDTTGEITPPTTPIETPPVVTGITV